MGSSLRLTLGLLGLYLLRTVSQNLFPKEPVPPVINMFLSLSIRLTNNRLGCKVKHKLRLIFFKYFFHLVEVPDVPDYMSYFIFQFSNNKIISFRVWLKSISNDICAKFFQPNAKPGTFESGVAGDENCFVFENIRENNGVRSSFLTNSTSFLSSDVFTWVHSGSMVRVVTSL